MVQSIAGQTSLNSLHIGLPWCSAAVAVADCRCLWIRKWWSPLCCCLHHHRPASAPFERSWCWCCCRFCHLYLQPSPPRHHCPSRCRRTRPNQNNNNEASSTSPLIDSSNHHISHRPTYRDDATVFCHQGRRGHPESELVARLASQSVFAVNVPLAIICSCRSLKAITATAVVLTVDIAASR